jgi:hypothetical protein
MDAAFFGPPHLFELLIFTHIYWGGVQTKHDLRKNFLPPAMQRFRSIPGDDQQSPILMLSEDEQWAYLETNQAYDALFPSSGRQLVATTHQREWLHPLLLLPSTEPKDWERFLVFILHILFTDWEESDAAAPILEHVRVRK